MSEPVKSNASTRGLARCLNAPGGIGIKDAISRAALHMEMMQERTLGVMEESFAGIVGLLAQIDGVPDPDTRKQLHELSCTLAGLGGMFGREALSKAAYSFCRLIDMTEPGWDAAAVAVHVHTMRLLFKPERVPADMQASLIEGLVKVRRTVAAPAAG